MEEKATKIENIVEDIRGYFHARQELIKMQAVEKISLALSNVITFIIILPFFLLAFLFVSFSLAQVLSDFFGHAYAGYLAVTGLYVITGLLLFRFRKSWLIKPIRNSMIKQILSERNE